ncbi:MAG: FAD-binding protein [Thermoguttaceae bacterium]|nr:FAD-binding protein [Thermoguttaceae bacterium]MDW8036518.1 FAD-linked oxidase C-terminal domain-containing protein [Thermoguttaceae bacterium]
MQAGWAAISALARRLRRIVGRDGVLTSPSELAVYECDGYTLEKHRPDLVIFPRSREEVVEIVRLCRHYRVPILARGAGTSLAGGCTPVGGGLLLVMTRMNRILQIDRRNRMAVVEPGVLNVQLARALEGTGLHFAPDPSSQTASTLGGNVATNAGGPHTLKYGVTANHVLGVEAVLADGSVLQVGPALDPPGYDLLGVLVGSEGTLAILTKLWLRLTPNPQDYRTMRAVFAKLENACNAISDIIGQGIIPAAMELMDQGILAAVEEAYHFGFPLDAEAVVIIEVDGLSVGLDDQLARIVQICQRWGARQILHAANAEERNHLWKCRKMAVGAVGRLSPSYCIQDGVVPRTQLPRIMRRIAEISRRCQIRIVNVAHAGDGNIHPILLFDPQNPAEVQRVLAASYELLEACLECGGSITAEHGIGIEKLPLMTRQFQTADLQAMRRVREAFDPEGLFAPGKLLPSAKGPASPSGQPMGSIGQSDGCEVGKGLVGLYHRGGAP